MPAKPKTPKPRPLPPTKYEYREAIVRYWHERQFPIQEIRKAVELIRYAPDTRMTGLLLPVRFEIVEGDMCHIYYAHPTIPFKEIEGKTLKQLLQLYDNRVDAIVERKRKELNEQQKNDQNVGA